MHTTKHRKVVGPLRLAVPPTILDDLPLQAGASVGFTLDGTKLMGEATSQIRYCLDDLLAQSDYRANLTIGMVPHTKSVTGWMRHR